MIKRKKYSVGSHSKRTSKYAKLIAIELIKENYYIDRINEDFIIKIIFGAPLHDIGKLYTPEVILDKPGELTDEEFAIMKLHTINGGKIIDGIIEDMSSNSNYIEFLNFSKEMALFHHERWDGNGYPFRLAGEDIPLSARIIAVADTFDAITSNRVYQNARTPYEALKIIQNESGKQFDPIIVSAFINIFDVIKKMFESKDKANNHR